MDVNFADGVQINAVGDIPDELARNYKEMDEAGKEILLRETEQILRLERDEGGQLDESVSD